MTNTEKTKAWREKNSERYADYNKLYYQRTKEVQKARAKAWREALTPEARRELNRCKKRRFSVQLEQKQSELAGRPRPERCENPCCLGTGAARSKTKKVVWDHNHSTGEFRGWLCAPCNSILGLAKDKPEILAWLADYLRQNGLGSGESPVYYKPKMYTGILRSIQSHGELNVQ